MLKLTIFLKKNSYRPCYKAVPQIPYYYDFAIPDLHRRIETFL